MMLKGRRAPKGTATPADALAGVTFNSQGSFVLKTGTIPNHSNSAVSPNGQPIVATGKLTIYPQNGYYDGTSAKVEITDSNIDPSNVKANTNLLGIDGTFTSDADATAEDIRQGKTAYVNGIKITGTAVF